MERLSMKYTQHKTCNGCRALIVMKNFKCDFGIEIDEQGKPKSKCLKPTTYRELLLIKEDNRGIH